MMQETRPCPHNYYSLDNSTGGIARCLKCGDVISTPTQTKRESRALQPKPDGE